MEARAGPRRGAWPKHPVIYQIYPRSFQDSTGSGEGDLAGITRRLDHVARLGVDAIWLSPFFASPMVDGGYDVADQQTVDPCYGTFADFDALVARAHDLELRVMIDQVFNHTSDQHPWFQKSLARAPGFEDFYVWADARADGSPPSNWIAYFGHPAWRWHPQRGQYCLHQFLPSQPGLNHSNPKVLEALGEITRFWRDRGVDGFRYDAVTSFFHDPDFRDNPPTGDAQALIAGPANNPFTMQRHVHDMLPDDCAAFSKTIRDWSGPDTYLIGEINQGPNSIEIARKFSAPDRLDAGYVIDPAERGLTGTVLADMLGRLEAPGPLAWWLCSHDQKRAVSRSGDGSARDARLMAGLLLALPGPILVFQGEELGTPQADLPRDALRDPFDQAFWPDPPGRDGARTPMVWTDAAPGYGFTQAETPSWLPFSLPEDGGAAQQWERGGSVLRFYQEALSARRALGLAEARVDMLRAGETCFVARLEGAGADVLLAVNLGTEALEVPEAEGLAVRLESAPSSEAGIAGRSAVWFVST